MTIGGASLQDIINTGKTIHIRPKPVEINPNHRYVETETTIAKSPKNSTLILLLFLLHTKSTSRYNLTGKFHHRSANFHVSSFDFVISVLTLTGSETGNYLACISAVDHKPEITLTLDFDWRSGVHSVHSKDWSKVAKKTQVTMMEFSVKNLLETVTSIHDEMFYLREREEEMQELNRSTNAKMGWLSFVSLVVCLSVAGLQFWHLKTFFEKKKLI